MVASQLNYFVSSNGLENVKQSAEELGNLTQNAFLSLRNDIHLALARGKATAVVLLNQLAAFDMFDHETLLDCVRAWFGIDGAVLG